MWLYKNKKITKKEELGDDVFGFVYIITNISTGEFYIGKKYITHSKTKKLGKKAIAEQTGPGRKKTKIKVESESDWLTYWSSSKTLQEQVKQLGEDKFTREILDLGYNSKHLNYLETKYQFTYCVLENSLSLNDNISGRFFRKDIINGR